jgi:hypothetical protein
MKNLLLIFSVLLSTSLYAQIGPDGTGTVNGYSIGPGADLSFALLDSANLSGANLIGANLTRAVLPGAYLSGAILIGADLSGAYLTSADLTDANLRYADLTSADLSGADLEGASLAYSDLSGADLSGANLRGAILSGANLTNADLSGADLSGADLTGADLFNANLLETIWSNVISQSDYDAVVAERDTALAAQASAEAERDARPTQAAYDAVVAERDAKLTLNEVKDLRAGSTMIEIHNGQATLTMEVEESDDLGIWTNGGASTLQIPIDAEAGKKFFRFKMAE